MVAPAILGKSARAVHALSTRITSLDWFNLSLKSLREYPDTWEPITRIGREIRMLELFYPAGDAYRFERREGVTVQSRSR
jgi:hypothetical protein